MKIGVFGDSYAEKSSDESSIWWGILNQTTEHDVTSHGESASSIMFSAKKILEHYQEYDLVIWCLTQSGRQTVLCEGRPLHFTPGAGFELHQNEHIRKKWLLYIDYWHSGLLDWDSEKLNGKALVHYVKDLCKNVMVVPCFRDPLEYDFNLFDLSNNEAKFYFGNKEFEYWHSRYIDLRPGHLSLVNQTILSEEISKQLKPGIFQSSYSKFSNPVDPVEKLFEKI